VFEEFNLFDIFVIIFDQFLSLIQRKDGDFGIVDYLVLTLVISKIYPKSL